MISSQASDYSHNNVRTFRNFFPGSECSQVETSEHLLRCLRLTVDNYYSLDGLSTSQYAHIYGQDGEVQPVQLQVTRYAA